MENQPYQRVRQLREEINNYSRAQIIAIELYREVKNNPVARRQMRNQLIEAIDVLLSDFPELGTKIPIAIKPETPIKIQINSQ